MMICKYCNKNFNTNRSLAAHIGAVHKEEFYKDRLNSYVTIGKDVLDITNQQLIELRSKHNNRCDICGKIETSNTRPDVKNTPNQLCVDHNHITKKFRGFLCVQCNRNMGWLDKYKSEINTYNGD